jgi:hypothetical protein
LPRGRPCPRSSPPPSSVFSARLEDRCRHLFLGRPRSARLEDRPCRESVPPSAPALSGCLCPDSAPVRPCPVRLSLPTVCPDRPPRLSARLEVPLHGIGARLARPPLDSRRSSRGRPRVFS